VGHHAVTLLMRKMSRGAGAAVPEATLLEPRLTIRASTAAPPG
jgi:DNA-binding LacI/PurR family transcriptional regulator